MTVAGSLLIALLALITDSLLGFIETNILKHGKKSKKQNRALVLIIGVIIICLLVGIFVPKERTKVIRIATKPMTEQYILGEMLKAVIEQDTGFRVNLTQGVGGGTSNIEPAIERGEFDLYPEYTGTGWNTVLKNKELYSEKLFNRLPHRSEERRVGKECRSRWSQYH